MQTLRDSPPPAPALTARQRQVRRCGEPPLFQSLDQAHPFADRVYLAHVIDYLKAARKSRGIRLTDLGRSSGLKAGLIGKAERGLRVPDSSEFKSWAGALGLSWDHVWTDTLRRNRGAAA